MNNNFSNISYEPTKVKSNKTFAVFDTIGKNFNFNYIFGRWSLLQIVTFTLLFISLFSLLNYTLNDNLESFRPFNFTNFLNFLSGVEVIPRIPTNLNLAFSSSTIAPSWLRALFNTFLAPINAVYWILSNIFNILVFIVEFIRYIYNF